MKEMRYMLVRFIRDFERMEPINIGVVLQDDAGIDFKLNPRAGTRKDVDATVYRKWRSFLEEEIRGAAVPLFQPPKNAKQFLSYLQTLCDGTVQLSPSLAYVSRSDERFEAVLDSLYDRLVATPDHDRDVPDRPTSTYRELEEQKSFRRRGMAKRPYLELPNSGHWAAFRQLRNGENIVIDKIEIGNNVGLTADEIQKMSSGAERFVKYFLGNSSRYSVNQYFLLADRLTKRFSDQSEHDFGVMNEELERVISTVKLYGGHVLSDPDEVKNFADDIHAKLPNPELAVFN